MIFYFAFNLEFVTRKQKKKSLTIELIAWSEIKYFQLQVINSKKKQKKFNYRVGN